MIIYNRRNFLKTSVAGGVAITFAGQINSVLPESGQTGTVSGTGTRVSISTANDRADLAFKALLPFSKQIKQAIG